MAEETDHKPNPKFPVWSDATCGHCDYDASEDEEPYLYHLICPICGRDGCDECMPLGRDCECPECEDSDEDEDEDFGDEDEAEDIEE